MILKRVLKIYWNILVGCLISDICTGHYESKCEKEGILSAFQHIHIIWLSWLVECFLGMGEQQYYTLLVHHIGLNSPSDPCHSTGFIHYTLSMKNFSQSLLDSAYHTRSYHFLSTQHSISITHFHFSHTVHSLDFSSIISWVATSLHNSFYSTWNSLLVIIKKGRNMNHWDCLLHLKFTCHLYQILSFLK